MIIFLYLRYYFMTDSIHMSILKVAIKIMFVLQSVLLILPTSVYRFAKKSLHHHPHHFNPFKSTHQDVFKKRRTSPLMQMMFSK